MSIKPPPLMSIKVATLMSIKPKSAKVNPYTFCTV